MSAAEILQQAQTLPPADKVKLVRRLVGSMEKELGEHRQALTRLLRRLEHPEVPEDFWEAWEEEEDGLGIEIKDEHFARPPA
jgi:hypothetical protein